MIPMQTSISTSRNLLPLLLRIRYCAGIAGRILDKTQRIDYNKNAGSLHKTGFPHKKSDTAYAVRQPVSSNSEDSSSGQEKTAVRPGKRAFK